MTEWRWMKVPKRLLEPDAAKELDALLFGPAYDERPPFLQNRIVTSLVVRLVAVALALWLRRWRIR